MSENFQPGYETCLLQIDRVGSYRLIFRENVLLSGPHSAAAENCVQILGPLSREHAEIRRQSSGYSITPRRGAVQLWTEENCSTETSQADRESRTRQGRLLAGESFLGQRHRFELAAGIQGRLRMPSLFSQTAVLEIEPADRFLPRVDGVILVDRMVVLGPGEQSHIRCSHWEQTGVLVFSEDRITFRSPIRLENQTETEKIDLELPFHRYVSQGACGFYLEALVNEQQRV